MTPNQSIEPPLGPVPSERPERRVVRYPPQTIPAPSPRGRPLTFTYEVNYVGGEEGERLNRKLLEATRELLMHLQEE